YFYVYVNHRHLHSFPTRRSSDLGRGGGDDLLPRARPDRPEPGSGAARRGVERGHASVLRAFPARRRPPPTSSGPRSARARESPRSEEHTSELQSLAYLVCRLLLE